MRGKNKEKTAGKFIGREREKGAKGEGNRHE